MKLPVFNKGFKLIGLLFLCIYVYFLYRLVVVPAALDYSYLGILVTGLACWIGMWILPKPWRLRVGLFVLAILMMLYGFQDLLDTSVFYRVVCLIVIVCFFAVILKRYANISVWWTGIAGVFCAILVTVLPMDELPFLAKFFIPFRSQSLVDATTADFPLYPVHVVHGGKGDKIATVTNRPFPPITKEQIDPKQDTLLVSYSLNKNGIVGNPMQVNQLEDSMLMDIGTSGFPYFTYSLFNRDDSVWQDYYMTQKPEQIVQNLLDLGSFPLSQERLELQTIESDQKEWDLFQTLFANLKPDYGNGKDGITVQNHTITGIWKGQSVKIPTEDTKFLGVAHVVPGLADDQVLTEGPNRFDVFDIKSGKLLSTYHSTIDLPLPGTLITADIDGDGQDEILLNTVPAQIIKLGSDGTWKTLWVSGRDSFRFECAGKLGSDSEVTIVANSPSELRNVDVRYLTGYRFKDGVLQRLWRVSRPNLVLAQLVHEKGSNEQDLVVTDYGNQTLTVLKPHSIPVQMILIGIFGLYLIAGFVCFRKWRREGYAHV